ncbi:MAG: hypothetical protein QOE65_1824 [Solirubrobacteraceae bacterium]|nr:hypothetical protein [Solirubrobacteraceae bacterium]
MDRAVPRYIAPLFAVLACLALAAPAHAFSGATVRGERVSATYLEKYLLVRVACPGATTSTGRPGDFSFCTGSARFYVGRRLVADGPFSIRTFDSHIEKMVVKGSARSLFKPGRSASVRWVISSHDGQGQSVTNGGHFTVFNPFKR